jgi:hypothetical protein
VADDVRQPLAVVVAMAEQEATIWTADGAGRQP